MNSDTTLSVGVLVLLIGCFLNLYNFFTSRKKDIKQEDKTLEDIKESILKLNFKSDQICSTTNETRTDIKSIKKDVDSVREDLIIQKQEVKALWRRVDEINKLLKNEE